MNLTAIMFSLSTCFYTILFCFVKSFLWLSTRLRIGIGIRILAVGIGIDQDYLITEGDIDISLFDFSRNGCWINGVLVGFEG